MTEDLKLWTVHFREEGYHDNRWSGSITIPAADAKDALLRLEPTLAEIRAITLRVELATPLPSGLTEVL